MVELEELPGVGLATAAKLKEAIENIKREITTSATMTNKRLTETFNIGLERLEKPNKN